MVLTCIAIVVGTIVIMNNTKATPKITDIAKPIDYSNFGVNRPTQDESKITESLNITRSSDVTIKIDENGNRTITLHPIDKPKIGGN